MCTKHHSHHATLALPCPSDRSGRSGAKHRNDDPVDDEPDEHRHVDSEEDQSPKKGVVVQRPEVPDGEAGVSDDHEQAQDRRYGDGSGDRLKTVRQHGEDDRSYLDQAQPSFDWPTPLARHGRTAVLGHVPELCGEHSSLESLKKHQEDGHDRQ